MRKPALIAFALVVAALVALGLIVLFSASDSYGLRYHKDAYFFLRRQSIYLGIGIVVAAVAAVVDYHRWRDVPGLAWFAYIAVAILLLFVFPQLGGRAINGSYRWIKLGPVNMQPSEFAKLMTVIILAVWLDRAAWRVELFVKGLLIPSLLIAVYAVLVIREPDFGSVMVIGFAGGLVMLVAGVRLRHLIPAGLLGGIAAGVIMCFNENRMRRIMAFVHSVFGGGQDYYLFHR